MTSPRLRFILVTLLATGTQGCAAPEGLDDGPVHAGWYVEHGRGALFRPCGAQRTWRISNVAALRVAAQDFGLQPDTPVYVRLQGSYDLDAGALSVARVEQFGSPTPVRDCAMTGVVIDAAAD
jgi:hypothetical protein